MTESDPSSIILTAGSRKQRERERVRELAEPLMRAIFYALFDEAPDNDVAQFGLEVRMPDRAVGEFLIQVLDLFKLDATVVVVADSSVVKLRVYAQHLFESQTQIMRYFAREASKVSEVKFRLPGVKWRPPSGKSEADQTVRETQFAYSYGREIQPDRLERILEEASLYNDEFERTTN